MGSPATELLPLQGFTVGVTAARRHDELAGLLRRRGAQVVGAPAIRLVPLADDTELLANTRTCLDTDVDLVVATTGIGFRGWMEVAAGWGLGERLHQQLANAEIVTRGPKATGAIRAAGLTEAWSPSSESMSGVLEHLLSRDLSGRRVVVQLHGEPLLDIADALTAAGADVLTIRSTDGRLPTTLPPSNASSGWSSRDRSTRSPSRARRPCLPCSTSPAGSAGENTS